MESGDAALAAMKRWIAVIARLDRAIQVRRDFSIQALASLEYWITRFRG